MPKHTKTKSGDVAPPRKKAGSSSQWRGLPAKLRDIPNSDQLFSMWGNDSFRRAPPVVPTNMSIWDAKDPSRPLPYSFQIPPPIAPPPIAGIAFVTTSRALRPKSIRARLLPALHPSSQSLSHVPPCSSTIAPSLVTDSSRGPGPPPSPHSTGYIPHLSSPPLHLKNEPVVERLPPADYGCGPQQCYGLECDDSSPERSLCSISRTSSPSTSVATPPSSPPLRPWSSPPENCLSPLMLGERLSGRDLANGSPAIARARSDPPETSSQSRGEEALSVYETCCQRRLPPMNFEKPVASSLELDLPRMGMGLVLPALRVHSSGSDPQGFTDEGRDFDASRRPERTARHSPYHVIPNAPRGAHKESETDLPPLRLLLDQLETDEHRRTQSESQSQAQPETTLAYKLLIHQAPAKKRRSPTSSRRRHAVRTVESATPVPTLSSSAAARVAPRYPGQGTVSGSGVVNPCTAGGRAAAAVHPQRGGLHAL
ncbi:hypothetical protein LXA43DRAFT_1097582 [Ganoderma leucocontextum]|nr:hypothetical protein LXA43DRAFT_1097582 [Ganoderma leucocontextum]